MPSDASTQSQSPSPPLKPSRLVPPEIFPLSSAAGVSFSAEPSLAGEDQFQASVEMAGADLLVEALIQNEEESLRRHLLLPPIHDGEYDSDEDDALLPGIRQYYDDYGPAWSPNISSGFLFSRADYLISEMEKELSRWPLTDVSGLDFLSKRKVFEKGEHTHAPSEGSDDNALDDLSIPDMATTTPTEEEEEEDGDASDDSFPDDIDPRYIGIGWAVECLQDPEDIDFEYVYALHTFVATVEGQANATKGDTMVLLDDSNSYWWLVRIVKDSSIGTLCRCNPFES